MYRNYQNSGDRAMKTETVIFLCGFGAATLVWLAVFQIAQEPPPKFDNDSGWYCTDTGDLALSINGRFLFSARPEQIAKLCEESTDEHGGAGR